MSHVYRFEIYPKVSAETERNVESTKEKELKHWLHTYMNVQVERVCEISFFLLETKDRVENIHEMALEVFCDEVIETLFSSESRNQEEVHAWLKKKGFKNPFLIERFFRPGVTDNSAHAALDALKLIPALSNIEMTVSSGLMYFIEGSNIDEATLLKISFEKF